MKEYKFLLIKGIAGLGNRMLCALTGILYARLTGRQLLIDWGDHVYSNDGSNVFSKFFQLRSCNQTFNVPDIDSVQPSIWRGHLHESALEMQKRYGFFGNPEIWRKFSIDLTRLDYQEDVLVMWTFTEQVDLLRCHFKGVFKELSQASTKSILSELLRENLILHPRIRERVDQFKSNWFRQKTVGVHLRYTDKRNPLWATLKKLNALLKQEPELQIFLSTDNAQIKNMFEENYPSVITTPHWYPTPGFPMHGSHECPDRREHCAEALVDLYLLAECDYLVIDTSSAFSRVASLLTNTPSSNIFDVRQVHNRLPPRLRRPIWKLMLKLGLFTWGVNILRKFVSIQRRFSW